MTCHDTVQNPKMLLHKPLPGVCVPYIFSWCMQMPTWTANGYKSTLHDNSFACFSLQMQQGHAIPGCP